MEPEVKEAYQRELAGYEARLEGAKSVGNDPLAKAMASRVAQVKAELGDKKSTRDGSAKAEDPDRQAGRRAKGGKETAARKPGETAVEALGTKSE